MKCKPAASRPMAKKIFGVKRKLGDPLPGREGGLGTVTNGTAQLKPGPDKRPQVH